MRFRNNGWWTYTTAPQEERRLRDLGLTPIQPLKNRVRLLQKAGITIVWGPKIHQNDKLNIQIHAWVLPYVADVLLGSLTDNARTYLFTECSRFTPGERDVMLAALAAILALEAPIAAPYTSRMLHALINGVAK